jgi:hypothetical protein
VSDLEPANCSRCGKIVLQGTVEETFTLRLDTESVPFSEALILHKWKVPLVDVRFRGERIVSSAMFWPRENETGTLTFIIHRCSWDKWGKG